MSRFAFEFRDRGDYELVLRALAVFEADPDAIRTFADGHGDNASILAGICRVFLAAKGLHPSGMLYKCANCNRSLAVSVDGRQWCPRCGAGMK